MKLVRIILGLSILLVSLQSVAAAQDKQKPKGRLNAQIIAAQYTLDNKALKAVNFSDANNEPLINVSLTSKASKEFSQLTKQYINKSMNIVLDNKIISAPII